MLELSIIIKYDAQKMKSYYTQLDNPADTIARLRPHLTALKMPHPKQDNVHPIGEDSILFTWTTPNNSQLQKQVTQAILDYKRTLVNAYSVVKTYFIESIEMTVKPADRYATAPLLLPTSSRRDSFSTSAPVDSPLNPSGMYDEAQQFLDELQLDPGPVPLASRATSVPSSTCSSRNETPPRIKHEVADLVAANSMEFLEADCLDLVTPDPCPLTPGSEDMVLSPIPGLATLPNSDTIVVDEPPVSVSDVERAPLGGDIPLVHQLSTALLDIRKEVASDLIKADAICQALRILDAPDIPEPLSELSLLEKDFVTRIRLQLLQSELEHARLRRQAVEEAIRDITRECRPPFVCAALIDAFVAVSQLTTQALGDED
ncbi:hypothetical protein DFH09DRAFT_1356543 [Mycena vulgaris]|nr:hypothetical protein DFH09DRAFT_1356543 [Mycena vulgaris]